MDIIKFKKWRKIAELPRRRAEKILPEGRVMRIIQRQNMERNERGRNAVEGAYG